MLYQSEISLKKLLHKNEEEVDTETDEVHETHRKLLKNIGFLIFGLLLIGGLGYVFAWPEVGKWRQKRSLAEAVRYEKEGDYRRAVLTLEQTTQLYPQNLEARRRLANLLERLGQRQALDEWKEIVRHQPSDARNQAGLAGAALRFRETELARQALTQLRETGQMDADYYRLTAGLALMSRDNTALEAALVELSKREPGDLHVQLNLALVRLRSAEPAHAEVGRTSLIRLAQADPVRIRAVVELFNDMAHRWPRPSRERVTAFQQLARVLTPARGPRFDPPEIGDPVERLVAFAMRQPEPGPEDVGALLSWLILNGRGAAGFEWLETLPAKTRDSRFVTAIASEATLQKGDWPHLRQLLLAGAWGNMPPEAVGNAFAAHENAIRTERGAGANQWNDAIASCQASLPALRMLLRLSEAWDWPEEQRQVLVAITRDFAGETWAWRQLISYALAHGESEQLWQLYQRWSRSASGDSTVQIETSIMGLFLQKRGASSIDSTAELLRQQPANPGAVVAHALALWRGHRLSEALPLIEALPSGAFVEPRYALAYGLLLADAGRARESEQMLNRASAERLLPDERLLIEQARSRNQLRLTAPAKP